MRDRLIGLSHCGMWLLCISLLLSRSDEPGLMRLVRPAFGQSLLATDCSTVLAVGGTAQQLCSGSFPPNGWTIINPDPGEDCWASDTTTASANGTGSIRLAANGGGYETPPFRKPRGPVSWVCPTINHKITASIW